MIVREGYSNKLQTSSTRMRNRKSSVIVDNVVVKLEPLFVKQRVLGAVEYFNAQIKEKGIRNVKPTVEQIAIKAGLLGYSLGGTTWVALG